MNHKEMLDLMEEVGYTIKRDTGGYNMERLEQVANSEGYQFDPKLNLWVEV